METSHDQTSTLAGSTAPSPGRSPIPSLTIAPVQSPAPSSQLSRAAPTPPATANPPESPRPTGWTKKTSRGSSFTTPEDEAMTKAWVRVSEDSIIGSDQKGEIFFKAIHELYNETKPSYCQLRSAESVKKRVKKILQDCLLFSSCVAKVNNNQPSGTNYSDCIHLATAIYNKKDILSVSDECAPKFKYITCWEILKNHPKFDLMNQPRKQSSSRRGETEAANDGGESSLTGEEAEEFSHPIDCKRAKVIDSRTDVEYKKFNVAEATLAAQTELNELMRAHQEILLFTSQTDDSDPIAKQYMLIMRQKALDRLLASESAPSPQNTPSSTPPTNPYN